jgi:hypothetical protein
MIYRRVRLVPGLADCGKKVETIMSQRDKFMARLAAAREAGLTDLKFFFMPTKPMEPEEIFGAMNEVEDAVRHNKALRHTGWKGNDPGPDAQEPHLVQ